MAMATAAIAAAEIWHFFPDILRDQIALVI